jgi:hypothetical protein
VGWRYGPPPFSENAGARESRRLNGEEPEAHMLQSPGEMRLGISVKHGETGDV